MDMKKILQSLDSVSAKPVEGADSMAKFLRVVKEAKPNDLTKPGDPGFKPNLQVPQIPVLPNVQLQSGANDLGNGVRIDLNPDGTKTHNSGQGAFTFDKNNKPIKYVSPNFSGFSQTHDLVTGNITARYAAGPVVATQTYDKTGKPLETGAEYTVGAQTLGVNKDAKGITSKQWTSKDPNITPDSKDLYAMGDRDKEATYNRAMAQVNNTPVQENSLSKFLSIVDKNNVSILNESANPHKVTLPVQMAMQHYQQPSAKVKPRTRLIDKYFTEAEATILQKKQEEKTLLKQYAQVIAERVLMKETNQAENFNPNASPNPGFKPGAGPGIIRQNEATFATTGGGAATGNPNITNKKTALATAASKPIDISIQGSGFDTNIVIEGIEVYGVGDFLLDLGFSVGIAALGAALSAPTAGTSARVAFGAIAIPARRAFAYVIKHISTVAKTHPELATKEAISAYVKTKSEFFKELIKSEFTARTLAITMGATAGFNTVVGVLEKNGVPLPDWLKKDKPFDPENPEASVKLK